MKVFRIDVTSFNKDKFIALPNKQGEWIIFIVFYLLFLLNYSGVIINGITIPDCTFHLHKEQKSLLAPSNFGSSIEDCLNCWSSNFAHEICNETSEKLKYRVKKMDYLRLVVQEQLLFNGNVLLKRDYDLFKIVHLNILIKPTLSICFVIKLMINVTSRDVICYSCERECRDRKLKIGKSMLWNRKKASTEVLNKLFLSCTNNNNSYLFIFERGIRNKCFDDNTTNNLDLLSKKLTKVEKIHKENNVVKREVFNGTTRSFDSTLSNGGNTLKCNETEEIDLCKTDESRAVYRNISATNGNLSNFSILNLLFHSKDQKSLEDLTLTTRTINNSDNVDKTFGEQLQLNTDANTKERIVENNVTGNAEITASDKKLENSEKKMNGLNSKHGNSNKESSFRRNKKVKGNTFQNDDERRNRISKRPDSRNRSRSRKHHNGTKGRSYSENRYGTTLKNILFNSKSNNKKERSFREMKSKPNYSEEIFIMTRKCGENQAKPSKNVTSDIFLENSTKSLDCLNPFQLRQYVLKNNLMHMINKTFISTSEVINISETRSITTESIMSNIKKANIFLYSKNFLKMTLASSETSKLLSKVRLTTIKYRILNKNIEHLNRFDQKNTRDLANKNVTVLDELKKVYDPSIFGAMDNETVNSLRSNGGYEYNETKYWKIIIIPVVATIFSVMALFGMVSLCWKFCCVPILKNIRNRNNCNCQSCSWDN